MILQLHKNFYFHTKSIDMEGFEIETVGETFDTISEKVWPH